MFFRAKWGEEEKNGVEISMSKIPTDPFSYTYQKWFERHIYIFIIKINKINKKREEKNFAACESLHFNDK